MTSQELVEALADKEHESWSRWMKWLFSVSTTNEDGSVTISAYLARRWKNQADTPYLYLDEREKESDRAEVRQIIPIIERYVEGV